MANLFGSNGAKVGLFAETEFSAAYHGIDSIVKDEAGNFIIVEAKGGTGALAEGQLGQDWIRSRVAKIISESEGKVTPEIINSLKEQLNSGELKAMLVSTSIEKGIVQAPSFEIRKMSEIGSIF